MSIKKHSKNSAFTIVELLIVVVVIAILAAITIVSYNGITKMARDSSIMSTLDQLSKKASHYAILNNDRYPENLSDVDIGDTGSVEVSYFASPDRRLYCMQGVLDGRSFFVSDSLSVQPGSCDGYVGVPGSGEASGPVTAAVEFMGDGGGLRAQTNESWSEVVLLWDPIADAQRYRVQVDRNTGTWEYVNKDTGSSIATGVQTCATRETGTWSQYCTGQISPSDLSVKFTHQHSRVQQVGVTYRYRLSAITPSGETGWQTVSVTPRSSGYTVVRDLRMEPISEDSFSGYTVSWRKVEVSNMPDPRVQIQVKKNDGDWEMVNKETGGSVAVGAWMCAALETGTYSQYCTAQVPIETSRLEWNNQHSRPESVSDELQYRARLRSNTIVGAYSDWSYFTYELPQVSTLAKPQAFTVTNSSGWDTVTLSWSNPSINVFNPNTHIQIKKSGGEWENVNKTSGGTHAVGVNLCKDINENSIFYKDYCSFTIDSSVSSVAWANAHVIPGIGQTIDYRIKYRSTTVLGHGSDWVQTSLSR